MGTRAVVLWAWPPGWDLWVATPRQNSDQVVVKKRRLEFYWAKYLSLLLPNPLFTGVAGPNWPVHVYELEVTVKFFTSELFPRT